MELPDITSQEELRAYMESLNKGGVLNEDQYITQNVMHRGGLSVAAPMNPDVRRNNPGYITSNWGAFPWWGTRNTEAMFGGGPGIATIPFERAGQSKRNQPYEKEKVVDLVRRSPEGLRSVDPRFLLGTQSGVTREGVDYYMSDEYAKTGRTYRDQSQAGNVYPVVYERESPEGTIEPLILSGHHRATAALLRGEKLRALVVRGRQGPPYEST